MKLMHLALLTSLVPLAPQAFADTIFNFSGHLGTDTLHDSTGDRAHGGPLTGTLTLNSSGTGFDAVDLNYNFGATPNGTIPIHFSTVTGTFDEGNGIFEVRFQGSNGYYTIAQKLDFRTADLAAYQGGAVCGTDPGSDCGGSLDSYGTISGRGGLWGSSNIESGSLSLANPVPPPPTTATPEPASLMLLGTGLFGAVGVLRRRVVR